jgi:TolB-like protein
MMKNRIFISIIRMTILVIITSLIGSVLVNSAYAQTTIAVFRFQYAEPVTSQDASSIVDKLRESFSSRSDATVLEPWLVDTMLNTQGSPQLMECKEPSCLIAMGYLLVVDYVISGNITKKGKRFNIAVTVADIKNNATSPEFSRTVESLTPVALKSAFAEFPAFVFESKQSAGKKVTVSSKSSAGSKKKSSVLKKVVFGVVLVGLVGGAGGGGYLYSKEKNKDEQQPQGPPVITAIEVPLDGMPTHPSP